MTCEVLDLSKHKEENSRHLAGEAVCLVCRHEWVGVAKMGSVFLECPDCKVLKGVFKNPVEPLSGEVCQCDCGSIYMVIQRHITFCGLCGAEQDL